MIRLVQISDQCRLKEQVQRPPWGPESLCHFPLCHHIITKKLERSKTLPGAGYHHRRVLCLELKESLSKLHLYYQAENSNEVQQFRQ